jgi:hypothetical protein
MPGEIDVQSNRYVNKNLTNLLHYRKDFMGVCDKKTTFEILDYFYESGGNFIDTANNYQVCLNYAESVASLLIRNRARSPRFGLVNG